MTIGAGVTANQVAWAGNYPFDQPKSDTFEFVWGEERPAVSVPRRGFAVLAAGSNTSPQQLERKFGLRSKPLALEAIILKDWTVVYSAHFTGYGSIPATLAHCPGSRTRAFVTWLDDDDLAIMHASEAIGVNYEYANGAEIEAIDRHGEPMAIDGFYRSILGPLFIQRSPIRLAAIPSTGTNWPRLSQRALLSVAAKILLPGEPAQAFIRRVIEDPSFRRQATLGLERLDPITAGL